MPYEYPLVVGHVSYVCHVTELMGAGFRAGRAVSLRDGSELWVVLDPGLVMHREASDFLRGLYGAGRSPHTIRAYAGRVASFLGWCAGQGVEWSSISLVALARFKLFVEAAPGRGGGCVRARRSLRRSLRCVSSCGSALEPG